MTAPENHNIALALSEMAARQPARTALIGRDGRRWTFQELDAHVSAYAHGLARLGLTSVDRVALMVPPSPEFIALAFALFRLQAPVILIDPGMGYRNLLRCLAGVGPTVFIGSPKANLFRRLNPATFATVRQAICVGPGLGLLGRSLSSIATEPPGDFSTPLTSAADLAAIIFTTGSTGPPKGVCYQHGVFQAQLRLIRDYYGITPEDLDQPAFPLFGLFATALGATAVFPELDPSRPARVNPARFIQSIREERVTYSFGSPAIWNVVSRYCLARAIILDSLRLVLMAGAPVSGELIDRVRRILPAGAVIHTPYGATEALPVASITGAEILAETWPQTRTGAGVCVGRPLPGNQVRIIRTSDAPIADWSALAELPPGEIGEIVVNGPVVTAGYAQNERENTLAKIVEGNRIWHRMGDLGYLDAQGRLWFCGRRAHRVTTAQGEMYTIPCEAIFNEHPAVSRSALVGVKRPGQSCQTPVLIVETVGKIAAGKLLLELRQLALANSLTVNIDNFLVHPAFPVDIRHNAKIFREKLAVWAAEKLPGAGA
ncbi:MAG: AMP-binding protein [Desulfobulbaceae bacterium]|nr:AMP-binding protein [Desulfobulbaceae bacterium]